MKKTIIYISILCLSGLTACISHERKVIVVTEVDTEMVVDEMVPEPPPRRKALNIYLGTWVVSNYLFSTNVSAFDEVSAKKYIGKTMLVIKPGLLIDQDSCRFTNMQIVSMNTDSIFREYKYDPKDLHINTPITVFLQFANVKEKDGRGCLPETGFVIQGEHLLVNKDGLFFELTKK